MHMHNFMNDGDKIREMRILYRMLEAVRHTTLPTDVNTKMEGLIIAIREEVNSQFDYFIKGLVRELAQGDHPRQIREALESNGGKISAIRYIREVLDIGLIEAKAVIDELAGGGHSGYSL